MKSYDMLSGMTVHTGTTLKYVYSLFDSHMRAPRMLIDKKKNFKHFSIEVVTTNTSGRMCLRLRIYRILILSEMPMFLERVFISFDSGFTYKRPIGPYSNRIIRFK